MAKASTPVNEECRPAGQARLLSRRPTHLASRLSSPFDVPIVVLGCLIPISVYCSSFRAASLDRAVGLSIGLAVFLVTYATACDEWRLRWAVAAHIALGTAVAGVGLVTTRWPDKIPALGAVSRRFPLLISGLPGAAQGVHPNELAGVLIWVVPLQWALLTWTCRSVRRSSLLALGLAGSTLLTSTVLLFTQSRGAWLGLCAGVAFAVGVAHRRVRLALLLGGAMALPVVLIWSRCVAHGVSCTDTVAGLVGDIGWSFRLRLWRMAVWGIQDYWLTGMGLGAFRHLVRQLYPLAIASSFDFGHAHNGFLQAGVDMGLVGIAVYTSIWWIALRLVRSAVHRSRGWLRTLGGGLAASIVASLMYNLFDTVALGAKPGFLFWLLLGLTAAAARLSQLPPVHRRS